MIPFNISLNSKPKKPLGFQRSSVSCLGVGPFSEKLILFILGCQLTFLPVMGFAQTDRPDKESEREKLNKDIKQGISLFNKNLNSKFQTVIHDQKTGALHAHLYGDAWIRAAFKDEIVKVYADRILVLAEIDSSPKSGSQPNKSEDSQESKEAKEKLEAKLKGIKPVSFYAEGHVRIEGEGVYVEADAFFHDHKKERGLAVRAKGKARLDALDRLKHLLNNSRLELLGQNFGEGPTMGPRPNGDSRVSPRLPSDAPREVELALPLTDVQDRKAIQLAFRAEFLRMFSLDRFSSETLSISSCDYGEPHFGVFFDGFKLNKVPNEKVSTEANGDQEQVSQPKKQSKDIFKKERDHYVLDPEGGWFHIFGVPLLPFPVGYWNTEWLDIDANPIRDVGFSNSSKFGQRLDVAWNLNWFLELLPGSDHPAVDDLLDNSRLDILTDYLSNRGFGHGASGVYGDHPREWLPQKLSLTDWSYYGRSYYYRIDDFGGDRTAPEGSPDIDAVRDWANVLHRQRIPYLGTLDVEYSERRDQNFLTEYFPETRTEKEQESLFYLRRNFGDNLALTGLYKYRTDEFETVRERLPEFEFKWLEQSVFNSGLYTTLDAQATHLRFRPGDDLVANSRRYGRLDALNEWSYPFNLEDYLHVRPFASGRLTFYETGQNTSDHSLSRESLLAGATVSQQWSRVFHTRGNLLDDWFGLTAIKHDVIPKVTYANRFESTLNPNEVFQFDEVDGVDNLEVVELSLRNLLWGRTRNSDARANALAWHQKRTDVPKEDGRRQLKTIPSVTRSVLDAEVSTIWYPQPRRDNNSDRYSLVDFDVTLYPSRHFYVRSRNFFDPNDKWDYALTDNSATFEPYLGLFRVTVGERFRPGVSEFVYGRLAFYLSRKYLLEGYYGYDLSNTDRTDAEVRLVRFTECLAWEVSYSFDAGERDNHTVTFNLYPVELFRDDWDRRGSQALDSRRYGAH